MRNPLFRTLHENRGLLALLATILIMGAIHFSVGHQRASLNLYFVPVALGAYRLGRRKGVCAALLSILIASIVMIADPRHYPWAQPEPWTRLLDFATWSAVLVLTAYLLGSLSEQRQRGLAEIHRAREAVLAITTKLLDSVDRDIRSHSSRVADYSVEIARTLALSETDVDDIRVAAWLHDIGKLESCVEALRRAAGPTPRERDEMSRHEDAGCADANSQRSNAGILTVISMITSHHERWDGMGSRCLKGDNIPLGARIIAVANTFDTLVTDGPYRVSKSHAEAIKVIQSESGQGFDPRVVDVFLKHRTVPAERLSMFPRTHIRGAAEILPMATVNGSERLDAAGARSMNGHAT